MDEQMVVEPMTNDQELRLTALDRAINYFYGREGDPEHVIEAAARFEVFLRGSRDA